MYGLIINMCNLVMILQRILDVINFNNPTFLLLVLGGLGECVQTLNICIQIFCVDNERITGYRYFVLLDIKQITGYEHLCVSGHMTD